LKPTSPGVPKGRTQALAWLERNQVLVLGFAVILLVAGLLLRDLTEGSPPALVVEDSPSSGRSVVVHVAGAVAAPGLYQLPSDARVQDAITAAGGPLREADLDAVNLARRLRDGEKIEVPGGAAEPAAVATLAPGEKLDLNAASVEELDTLPGIGEAYSRRIVDSRAVDGPYEAVDDLVTRRVLPASTLDDIRDLVTVNAP
jgi:competence protein ComEA